MGSVNLPSKSQNPFFDDVFDVTVQDVNENKSSLYLVDVRSSDEFTGELGHIPGSTLITLPTLPTRLPEVPKDKTVVFVCRSGSRSAQAAQMAITNGWTQVFNMKGGMLAWNQFKYEIEK